MAGPARARDADLGTVRIQLSTVWGALGGVSGAASVRQNAPRVQPGSVLKDRTAARYAVFRKPNFDVVQSAADWTTLTPRARDSTEATFSEAHVRRHVSLSSLHPRVRQRARWRRRAPSRPPRCAAPARPRRSSRQGRRAPGRRARRSRQLPQPTPFGLNWRREKLCVSLASA